MGKIAVRDGSVSGSPNGVRRSAPFDVHEYTPLEVRGVCWPGSGPDERKRRTRTTQPVQRIFGRQLDVVQSTPVMSLNPVLVIWR